MHPKTSISVIGENKTGNITFVKESWRKIRRALLQFWSFKIRRATFLNYMKLVDPRNLRL